MRGWIALSRSLERIVSGIGNVAAWLALPLMLVIVFDVVTRKLNLLQGTFLQGVVTSTKLQELEWHLHAALFLLCFAWAYFRDAHVRIDLVRDRFGPRTKAWIELIGCLLFLIPYAVLVTYYAQHFWWRSWLIDEGSAATTGLPNRWIIKFALPLGFVLLFAAGLAMVINRIAFLRGHTVPDYHRTDRPEQAHGN
jgi:TRAP-type mannitol/chloroaromatic compound transport system permease small subunit